MAPLLQADGVSMSFGGVHALSGVSFTLRQGETLGLIGPNGAGKTTLFNCITGVVPGYRGSILYDGRDLRSLKPHQRARLRIARPVTWSDCGGLGYMRLRISSTLSG